MSSYQPLMDGKAHSNVYEEHAFSLRVVFGSSTITNYYGKDVVFARTGTGAFTWTLPKPYRKLIRFTQGWVRASGAPLEARITSYDMTTGIFTIQTVNTSGTATDPTSGDELCLVLGVTENTLNDMFYT